jgi:hypothetical protein
MNFDLQRVLASKRVMRQRLAALSVGEKLRLLDSMAERERSIRGASLAGSAKSAIVREEPPDNKPD